MHLASSGNAKSSYSSLTLSLKPTPSKWFLLSVKPITILRPSLSIFMPLLNFKLSLKAY